MDDPDRQMMRPRSTRRGGEFDALLVLLIIVVIGAAGWFWTEIGPALDDSGRPVLPAASVAALDPSAQPSASAPESTSPSPSPSPSPSRTPAPVRKAVTVNLLSRPAAYFSSEATKIMCADAAIQTVTNIVKRPAKPNLSRAFQNQIAVMARSLTTSADSHNRGWGPAGMAAAITDLSGVEYQLRIYRTRAQAVRASAIAVEATKEPVVWLAWRGAHSWVMSGFKADADPRKFTNAKISGVYILDPWYPRVSTIWGRSDKPGTFQNVSEINRNFLPWKRPEGRYPGRDGHFLVIMPSRAPKP